MRNIRLAVSLHDWHGNFMKYLVPTDAGAMLAKKTAQVRKRRGLRILAIALLEPPPPPSDSPGSSATITANESMVNAGVGLRFQRTCGHVRLSEIDYISRAHRENVSDKVECFKVPSYADRLAPALA